MHRIAVVKCCDLLLTSLSNIPIVKCRISQKKMVQVAVWLAGCTLKVQFFGQLKTAPNTTAIVTAPWLIKLYSIESFYKLKTSFYCRIGESKMVSFVLSKVRTFHYGIGVIIWIQKGFYPTICSRSMYVSYGGLLMRLTGSAATMEKFELDSTIYLLMKKVPY